MKTTKSQSFFGAITIGLQKGYSNDLYSKEQIIKALQGYQDALIKGKNIYLSAAVSECLIVLNNQVEPHIKLEFINYPKFPLDESVFKSEINLLGIYLMKEFKQNRIVITYHDETVMFEQNERIDPRI